MRNISHLNMKTCTLQTYCIFVICIECVLHNAVFVIGKSAWVQFEEGPLDLEIWSTRTEANPIERVNLVQFWQFLEYRQKAW